MLSKNKNKILVIVILCIVFIALFFGLYKINHSSFLVNKHIDDHQYLSLADYELIDSSTNITLQDSHSHKYVDKSQHYTGSPVLTTYRGVTLGDSWEQFVDKYGNYTARYISCSYYDNGVTSDNCKNIELNWITINEFNTNYVENNTIDINHYLVSIIFTCKTKGLKYLTTQQQIEEFNANFIINFKALQYNLFFCFYPSSQYESNSDFDYSYLEYISSWRMN